MEENERMIWQWWAFGEGSQKTQYSEDVCLCGKRFLSWDGRAVTTQTIVSNDWALNYILVIYIHEFTVSWDSGSQLSTLKVPALWLKVLWRTGAGKPFPKKEWQVGSLLAGTNSSMLKIKKPRVACGMSEEKRFLSVRKCVGGHRKEFWFYSCLRTCYLARYNILHIRGKLASNLCSVYAMNLRIPGEQT